MTKQSLTHPIDILKDLGVPMTAEAEAESRRVCNELTIICPQCNADVIKELGCNGCSSSCPITEAVLRLGASTCEYCRQGAPLTMGMHRRGKGAPVGPCAFYGQRQLRRRAGVTKRSIEEIRKADAVTVGELYGELQPKVTAFNDESPWQVAVDRNVLLAQIDRLERGLSVETVAPASCRICHDGRAFTELLRANARVTCPACMDTYSIVKCSPERTSD